MQWLTGSVDWIFAGLIFFIVVGVIAFFARNAVAKDEKNMSPDNNAKTGGDVPIQKSRQ